MASVNMGSLLSMAAAVAAIAFGISVFTGEGGVAGAVDRLRGGGETRGREEPEETRLQEKYRLREERDAWYRYQNAPRARTAAEKKDMEAWERGRDEIQRYMHR